MESFRAFQFQKKIEYNSLPDLRQSDRQFQNLINRQIFDVRI